MQLHEGFIHNTMGKDQEQTTEDMALQQDHSGVVADDLQVSFALIKIETSSAKRVVRRAVIDYGLGESQMTQAGVMELGFSLETTGGKRRRRIKLLLGAPGEPHSFRVTFMIVAEADHDIMLDGAAADSLHESSRGTNYPVFAVPGVIVRLFPIHSLEERNADASSVQGDAPEESPGSKRQT